MAVTDVAADVSAVNVRDTNVYSIVYWCCCVSSLSALPLAHNRVVDFIDYT